MPTISTFIPQFPRDLVIFKREWVGVFADCPATSVLHQNLYSPKDKHNPSVLRMQVMIMYTRALYVCLYVYAYMHSHRTTEGKHRSRQHHKSFHFLLPSAETRPGSVTRLLS